MGDFSGFENSKQIKVGEEVIDMISEYIEKPWYTFESKEEGVYRMEYSKESIETIEVFEKPKYFFQKSRLIDKTRDLCDKKWIELFYFEKGKTYYINLILKPTLSYGTYTFKISEHEVPANNYRETAYPFELSEQLEGKIDYVTDMDWFIFTAKETADYKVIYSRAIDEAIYFYEGENKKPEYSLEQKIYLVNDTVCEKYHFEEGKTYYMRIEHIQHRNLGKYIVRFTKEVDDSNSLRNGIMRLMQR